LLAPKNGRPYNQLAILALYTVSINIQCNLTKSCILRANIYVLNRQVAYTFLGHIYVQNRQVGINVRRFRRYQRGNRRTDSTMAKRKRTKLGLHRVLVYSILVINMGQSTCTCLNVKYCLYYCLKK
jgi:hypothetical protein